MLWQSLYNRFYNFIVKLFEPGRLRDQEIKIQLAFMRD